MDLLQRPAGVQIYFEGRTTKRASGSRERINCESAQVRAPWSSGGPAAKLSNSSFQRRGAVFPSVCIERNSVASCLRIQGDACKTTQIKAFILLLKSVGLVPATGLFFFNCAPGARALTG
ncbi:hypothetical protein NPIL_280701 [Nephila pilipes]|uniref:Uncharacterized protein n=1 Tax=Nephila pilipes TaxID=299642 RepID=A0A8X6IKD3_NEPPI|nr:hypothetical protein NPIL_280701 [Nephila pilipes]